MQQRKENPSFSFFTPHELHTVPEMANSDPLYCLWHRVRAPFKVPQSCHRCSLHDWEVFDVDRAGCRVCGRFHQCMDGGDCICVSESDHQVCEITGCWTKARNFQQGYTDTAMPTASADLQLTPKPWVESDRVAHWLHTLLFSEAARRCIDREVQRVTDKVWHLFLHRKIHPSATHIRPPRPPRPLPASPNPGSSSGAPPTYWACLHRRALPWAVCECPAGCIPKGSMMTSRTRV